MKHKEQRGSESMLPQNVCHFRPSEMQFDGIINVLQWHSSGADSELQREAQWFIIPDVLKAGVFAFQVCTLSYIHVRRYGGSPETFF